MVDFPMLSLGSDRKRQLSDNGLSTPSVATGYKC